MLASDETTARQFNTTDFPNRETAAAYQDAAAANWGTGWSLPTDAQFKTLINADDADPKDKCSVTYVDTGDKGIRVTGTTTGYTYNSIFLPSAGIGYGSNLNSVGEGGSYWSSVLSSINLGYILYFLPDYTYSSVTYGSDNFYGYPVRPVRSSL